MAEEARPTTKQWKRIAELSELRDLNKLRLDEAISERKTLNNEADRIGYPNGEVIQWIFETARTGSSKVSKPTPEAIGKAIEFLQISKSHLLVLREIEYYRDSVKELGDKVSASVSEVKKNPGQEEFDFIEADAQLGKYRVEASSADLFKPKEEDKDQTKFDADGKPLPVGGATTEDDGDADEDGDPPASLKLTSDDRQPLGTKGPTPITDWRQTPIEDVPNLSDLAMAFCNKTGMIMVGDVLQNAGPDQDGVFDLTKPKDGKPFTPHDQQALAAFFIKHEKDIYLMWSGMDEAERTRVSNHRQKLLEARKAEKPSPAVGKAKKADKPTALPKPKTGEPKKGTVVGPKHKANQ